MIAAFLVILGRSDFTPIVQTPAAALYPGSLVGMLKSIVFLVPTAPLTRACSCELSEETCRVPFDTSIASRSDKVESAVVSSAVVFTVIDARSWRSSSSSTCIFRRRRNFGALKEFLMGALSLVPDRVRWNGL